MNAFTRSPGQRYPGMSDRARLAIGLLLSVVLVLTLAGTLRAQSNEFEVTIPVETVVRDVGPGTVVLLTDPPVQSPEQLVGRECTVVARSENQSSVHPDSDLVVATGDSEVVIDDVESSPGATTNASGTVVLGPEVSVSLIMGPDDVFSAGVEVTIDCAPGATTTTESPTTTEDVSGTDETTTTESPTTTEDVSGTEETTTTEATTTTTEATTTTTPGDGSGTDGGDTTTTTIEDEVLGTEVLPFTGPGDGPGLGLFALALVAVGLVMVRAGREPTRRASPLGRGRHIPCAQCGKPAEFNTPHGRLCWAHTREAIYRDQDLWVPRRIDPDEGLQTG